MLMEDGDIIHYGVKGMRWGVRRDRKAAAANLNKASDIVNKRQEQRRLQATLTEADFKNLSDKKIVFQKGTTLNRITRTAADEDGNLYVSVNPKDAEYYRGLIPLEQNNFVMKNYGTVYEKTFTALEDLKSPSEKERVSAYIRVMDSPVITVDGKALTGREYLRERGLGDVVNGLSSREVALTYYGQLAAQQGIKNEPINSAVFKDLSRRGYNAIIDDNDRGIIAETPLLLLKPASSIRTESIKQLSEADILQAQKNLAPPATDDTRR